MRAVKDIGNKAFYRSEILAEDGPDRRLAMEVASYSAALWEECGKNDFIISDSVLAALLETELPERFDIQLPFDSFHVTLETPWKLFPMPGQMRKLEGGTYSEIDFFVKKFFVAASKKSIFASIYFFCDACNLVRSIKQDHYSQRIMVAPIIASAGIVPNDDMSRLVVNLCAYIQENGTPRETPVPRPVAKKRLRSPGRKYPKKRHVSFINLPSQFIESVRTSRELGTKITSRFIVRGHWRNQLCGRGRSIVRRMWIRPHWKGPLGANVIEHTYTVGK